MLAAIQPFLPYLLPMILLAANEVFANNPKLQANSLVGFIWGSIKGALQGAIGANPVKPIP